MFIKAEYYNHETEKHYDIVLNTEYIKYIEPIQVSLKAPDLSKVYMDTGNGRSSFTITSPTFDILVARLTN